MEEVTRQREGIRGAFGFGLTARGQYFSGKDERGARSDRR